MQHELKFMIMDDKLLRTKAVSVKTLDLVLAWIWYDQTGQTVSQLRSNGMGKSTLDSLYIVINLP
jgi:hypothetical protein